MEKKVFAFLGDFYHQRAPMEKAVQKAISDLENASLVSQLATAENINLALDADPAMIILGAENRINPQDEVIEFWLTNELDDKLETYVASGGNLVVLHSALASYPADSKYRKMIKGEFISHPPEHVKVRYYTSAEEGILSGDAGYDYEVIDEFYVVDVDTEETNVFLYSECEVYGEGLGGWYHDYGKGKVVCVVPTHNVEGFEHEETLRLYRDAIEWGLN